MKKLSIFLLLLLFGINTNNSARVFSNFDIATWYLNADLVIVCSVNSSDTILFEHFDNILSDTSEESYDVVQEQYNITVHSVLNNKTQHKQLKKIYTPKYTSNYKSRIEFTPKFKHLDQNGDSVFYWRIFTDKLKDDNEHFRLNDNQKYIVILNKSGNKYHTVYQTEYNEESLELFNKIDKKGDSYFAYLKKSASKGKFENLYPGCPPRQCPESFKPLNTNLK